MLQGGDERGDGEEAHREESGVVRPPRRRSGVSYAFRVFVGSRVVPLPDERACTDPFVWRDTAMAAAVVSIGREDDIGLSSCVDGRGFWGYRFVVGRGSVHEMQILK